RRLGRGGQPGPLLGSDLRRRRRRRPGGIAVPLRRAPGGRRQGAHGHRRHPGPALMSSDQARKLALVTGASGGIGYELALILARHGHDLVLVARRADKLAALAERLELDHGIRVRVIAKDLARPEAAAEIHETLAAEGLAVDVLVNNAGVGLL